MKCPHCNSILTPDTDLMNNATFYNRGLPINYKIEKQFRCTSNYCRKPIVLVSGIWYKWVYHNSSDMFWQPFKNSKPKPRKISSDFIGSKRVVQL